MPPLYQNMYPPTKRIHTMQSYNTPQKANYMQNYYTTIPTYITTRDDLTGDEKIFYATILSLCCKYGFCWASNKFLALIAHKSISQIHRYLRKLIKLGFLIVEMEHINERKIWTKETWPHREDLKKSFNQDFEFNQRFYGCVMDDTGGVSSMTPNKDNDISIHKEKEDRTRQKPSASPTVPLSFKNKDIEQRTASPPKKKEKDPLKRFELTEQERKNLQDRLGTDLAKYEEKRAHHLKKCPKSLYHKKRAYDTILEWYNQDRKEKVVREQAKEANKTQAALKREMKGKQLVTDVLKENPKHTHMINPYRDYVELGPYSSATGRTTVMYDDPELYRKIENMLHKEKQYKGLDFKMPLTEKEYLEQEGL